MPKKYILEKLLENTDSKYREFHIKLVPNISHDKTLGVRVPKLREIAKQAVKDNLWKEYLEITPQYIEEIMIQGIIIASIKVSLEDRLSHMKDFIPKIDNWAICDIFCCTLKLNSKEKEELWTFIEPYFLSGKTYDIRFAVVTSLSNFHHEEKYIRKVFSMFERIKSNDYYVQMAIAWAISVYFIKHRETTLHYLTKNNLDRFTQNKAIQKIRESRRVSAEDKEIVNTLKRKA